MTEDLNSKDLMEATERFRRAHVQALLQDWWARLTGRDANLLSYEEVRTLLQGRDGVTLPSPQNVPLDKIVGSVGRYRDFTQAFLPRNDSLRERWRRVDAAMNSFAGVPPVELYQVGDLYFVRDGNHRVSVARARGDKTIEAYVTTMDLPFPVEADSAKELSAWLTEASHRLFLERTHLAGHFPGADVRLTEPGRYFQFDEQIEVHRWYMGEAEGHEISNEEAVRSWYENIYQPLTAEIRNSGLLKDFPGRTEADLYLWICQHREELRHLYHLDLDEKAAVSTFASVYSGRRLAQALKDARLALMRMTAGGNFIIGLPDETAEPSATAAEAEPVPA